MSRPKEITVKDIVGMTVDQVGETDSNYGFYDWFCKDSKLKSKARRLLAALRGVVKTGTKAFDPEKTYAFFKNSCTAAGELYDDFRVADAESGEVLYTVCPKNPWRGNKPTVAFESRWDKPLVFDSMKGVRAWFGLVKA